MTSATSQADDTRASYEALGIFPDVWACVATMDERDTKEYVVGLALSGVPVQVARDPDGKRYHIAVKGGLIDNPAAFFVTLRGPFLDHLPVCTGDAKGGQHPQVSE